MESPGDAGADVEEDAGEDVGEEGRRGIGVVDGVTELVTDVFGSGPPGPPGFQPIGILTGVPESLQNLCQPDVTCAVCE
jgi:hypothetical protein